MNDIITDIFAMTRALYPEARTPERPKSHRVLYPALPPERPLYPDQPGYQKPEAMNGEDPAAAKLDHLAEILDATSLVAEAKYEIIRIAMEYGGLRAQKAMDVLRKARGEP